MKKGEKVNFNGPIGWATVAFSLLLGVGLFFLLPTAAATGVGHLLGLTAAPGSRSRRGRGKRRNLLGYHALPIGWEATVINFIEAVIQLGLLIAYIWGNWPHPGRETAVWLSRRGTQNDQRLRSWRGTDAGNHHQLSN